MSGSDKIEGGCLCGAFRFAVEGPLGDVRLCHCELCRRANGSAFSANSRVPRKRLRILTERASITEYQSTLGAWRAFCAICGSPVYGRVDWDPDHLRLSLGILDRETPANIVAHVWVGSKAIWDNITDELPRFEQRAETSSAS
jgi:hypothetical protein